jgi:hypothetical protein
MWLGHARAAVHASAIKHKLHYMCVCVISKVGLVGAARLLSAMSSQLSAIKVEVCAHSETAS